MYFRLFILTNTIYYYFFNFLENIKVQCEKLNIVTDYFFIYKMIIIFSIYDIWKIIKINIKIIKLNIYD